MFVSSYATYIDTTNTSSPKSKSNSATSNLQKFKLAHSSEVSQQPLNQPINDILNKQVLANRYKLQQQFSDEGQVKFKQINTLQNAHTAYTTDSKKFSLIPEPKRTQNTLKHQEHKTLQMKSKAINTYISNDNYFKITAS